MEQKKIDFNTLKDMEVGTCITSEDGKMKACRASNEEWVINSTDRFKKK